MYMQDEGVHRKEGHGTNSKVRVSRKDYKAMRAKERGQRSEPRKKYKRKGSYGKNTKERGLGKEYKRKGS